MKNIIHCFVLLLISSIAIAQNINQTAKIVTNDGTIMTGKVVESDDNSVTIETAYGANKILTEDIVSIDYTDSDSDTTEGAKESEKDYYSGSHYLWGQSAFGLKKGQAYYENTYLFLNAATYGVTDNFSIGVGTEVVSLLFGEFPLTYITPKVSIPFKGGAVSLGTTLIHVPWDGGSETAGLLSGALTLGTLRSNITFGVGFGYTFEDGFEDSFAPFSISGMHRVSNRIALVSENVFVSTDDFNSGLDGVFTAGIRIFSRRETNFLTISLLRSTGDNGGPFAWPFFSGTVKLK